MRAKRQAEPEVVAEEHVLGDDFVIEIAKSIGKGMSKAQRLAIAPVIRATILKTYTRKAKCIDAHAPISDPLTAHVIGETTIAEVVKDFAEVAGVPIAEAMAKVRCCLDCNKELEVYRYCGARKRCSPCANLFLKIRTAARARRPDAKDAQRVQNSNYWKSPKGKRARKIANAKHRLKLKQKKTTT